MFPFNRLIIKLARNGAVKIDSDVVNGMIGICLSNASLLFLSKICAPSINAKSCMIVVRFVEIFSRLSSLFIINESRFLIVFNRQSNSGKNTVKYISAFSFINRRLL
ncbi:hypothetical protein DERP_001546 [Dermatophagoides pteronyssinus]|uniref:Uncharacterized protein n=1 Tax=Dermatophagoides pteronyssinus TaxID=6956 RepID=A0ABQ8JAT8_DERPT|nr:hypothetical protein DERP_001546 [Dermatophagoides pteronyssinus]